MTNDERRHAFMQASLELAHVLGQEPMVGIPLHSLEPGDEFWFASSRPGHRPYLMVVTPDYTVVHQDEGCEAEHYDYAKGPCRHCKESEIYVTNQRTQAPPPPAAPPPTDLVVYDGAKVPMLIDFTEQQLTNIRDVVCAYQKNGGLVKAPLAFVEQFVASCRATGLNPFLHQIYALPVGPTGWSVYAGIDGYRVTANRNGLFEGTDGPYWAIVEEDGMAPKADDWVQVPAWQNSAKLKGLIEGGGNLFCRVMVYKKGSQRGFQGLVDFKAYGFDKVGKPGSRWTDDPCGQLAKCAEMQAFRRGFGLETALIQKLAFEAEASYELPESPAVAEVGLPAHLREEISRREATPEQSSEVHRPPMAEEPPVKDGEWRDPNEPRDDEYAPPAGSQEQEQPAAAPVGADVKPAILLNQIARNKKDILLGTNHAIESHYGYIVTRNGGRDLSKLTPEDEVALSDLLRDWLADRTKPHPAELSVDAQENYCCGICGVIMRAPEGDEGTENAEG